MRSFPSRAACHVRQVRALAGGLFHNCNGPPGSVQLGGPPERRVAARCGNSSSGAPPATSKPPPSCILRRRMIADEFAGRVALITGAARGLGLAAAERFLAWGARGVMDAPRRGKVAAGV